METKFHFTKAAIDALPLPSGARQRYMDQKEAGLALGVTSAGKKTFYLYMWNKGRPVEKKIGNYPDMSVEAARLKAREAKHALDKGEDPSHALGRSRNEMTFGELAEWWMVHAKRVKKSWEMDEQMLDKHLTPLNNRRLSTISRGDLRQLHARISQKAPHSANRCIELMRAMFNRAIDHEIFPGPNPALGVEMNKKVARDRRLMPGEMEAFFKALDECPTQDMRDYVYLSLYTGARRANILSMRWDQLDLKGNLWRIPETKNGLPQVIPLLEHELEILRRRKAEVKSPWVFPTRSKTGHMVEPKTGWRNLLKKAGLYKPGDAGNLRMHDLRRTLGSYMADTGASLHLIGKTLGHQSQSATAIYARFSLDPIREAKAKAVGVMLEGRSMSGPD